MMRRPSRVLNNPRTRHDLKRQRPAPGDSPTRAEPARAANRAVHPDRFAPAGRKLSTKGTRT